MPRSGGHWHKALSNSQLMWTGSQTQAEAARSIKPGKLPVLPGSVAWMMLGLLFVFMWCTVVVFAGNHCFQTYLVRAGLHGRKNQTRNGENTTDGIEQARLMIFTMIKLHVHYWQVCTTLHSQSAHMRCLKRALQRRTTGAAF